MSEEEERKLVADVEKAISDVLAGYGDQGILVDWVVVSHQLHVGEPGEDETESTGFFASESQPKYRTLGLLDYARTTVIKDIHTAMEDDR